MEKWDWAGWLLCGLAITGWVFALTLLEYATKLRQKLNSMGVSTSDWTKW